MQVLKFMHGLVWHRWADVGSLFTHGLGIEFPSMNRFGHALRMRHDIVHRSGQTFDGKSLDISEADVEQLAEQVLEVANLIDARIAATEIRKDE